MGLDLYARIEPYLDFEEEIYSLHKEFLKFIMVNDLDNIIDIGLENKNNTQPKRKEKKPLQVVFAKSEKLVLPKPDFLVNWEFDPAQVLLEDRKSRNDFVLS